MKQASIIMPHNARATSRNKRVCAALVRCPPLLSQGGTGGRDLWVSTTNTEERPRSAIPRWDLWKTKEQRSVKQPPKGHGCCFEGPAEKRKETWASERSKKKRCTNGWAHFWLVQVRVPYESSEKERNLEMYQPAPVKAHIEPPWRCSSKWNQW